jgi:hypothetical protein
MRHNDFDCMLTANFTSQRVLVFKQNRNENIHKIIGHCLCNLGGTLFHPAKKIYLTGKKPTYMYVCMHACVIICS